MEDNSKTEKFEYYYSASEEKQAEQIYKTYQLSDEDRFESMEKIDSRTVNQGKFAAISISAVGCVLVVFAAVCLTALDDTWFYPGLLIGLSGLVNVVSGFLVGNLTIKLKRRLNAPNILEKSKK